MIEISRRSLACFLRLGAASLLVLSLAALNRVAHAAAADGWALRVWCEASFSRESLEPIVTRWNATEVARLERAREDLLDITFTEWGRLGVERFFDRLLGKPLLKSPFEQNLAAYETRLRELLDSGVLEREVRAHFNWSEERTVQWRRFIEGVISILSEAGQNRGDHSSFSSPQETALVHDTLLALTILQRTQDLAWLHSDLGFERGSSPHDFLPNPDHRENRSLFERTHSTHVLMLLPAPRTIEIDTFFELWPLPVIPISAISDLGYPDGLGGSVQAHVGIPLGRTPYSFAIGHDYRLHGISNQLSGFIPALHPRQFTNERFLSMLEPRIRKTVRFAHLRRLESDRLTLDVDRLILFYRERESTYRLEDSSLRGLLHHGNASSTPSRVEIESGALLLRLRREGDLGDDFPWIAQLARENEVLALDQIQAGMQRYRATLESLTP